MYTKSAAHVAADVHIEGTTTNNQANTNFGSDTLLRLKRANTAHTTRHGLLRFSLNALADDLPVAARLILNAQTSLASNADWVFSVRPILSSTWTESTVTWNNAPAFGNALATYAPSPTRIDTIDVTNHALAQWSSAAPSLDLALVVNAQPGDSVFNYYSKENSANLPARVEFDVIPAAARFTRWIARPQIPAGQRESHHDPDGDGVPNLLEMALGRDPAIAENLPAFTVNLAQNRVEFELAAVAPAFTRLALETSVDLTTWTPVAITAAHLSTLPNGRRRVSVPTHFSSPRQFWRLRIEPESGTSIP